jgi:predicted small metal-binding protein
MAKVIHCPCGYTMREPSEEEVVQRAQNHARDAHNLQLTRDEALAMIEPE